MGTRSDNDDLLDLLRRESASFLQQDDNVVLALHRELVILGFLGYDE